MKEWRKNSAAAAARRSECRLNTLWRVAAGAAAVAAAAAVAEASIMNGSY